MSREQSTTESEQKRRGRRRSTHSHHAVLDATTTVLTEVGYTALTLEAVAARAGVSRATIYRWWPSKASLVIEALDHTLPTPAPAPTGDTRTDVRGIVQAVLDGYVHTPLGLNLALIASDAAADPDARTRLGELLGPRRAADASMLLAAAGRGDLPHDLDTNLVLDLVLGALVLRTLLGVRSDERTVDQLTDLIVDGAAPRLASRSEG